MKKEELLRAMSEIDDSYLLEASSDAPQKQISWRRRPAARIISGLAAACFVIVLIRFGGFGVPKNTPENAGSQQPVQEVQDVPDGAEMEMEMMQEVAAEDAPVVDAATAPEAETETESESESEV